MMKKNNLGKKLVIGILLAFLLSPFNVSALSVSSDCAVLMEQISGRVLYEKCPDDQMYIASITKILTALVAIENADPQSWVEIDYNVIRQVGSSLYLVQGDQLLLIDLLYGLMLRSGNDSAMAIAQFVGGSEEGFVAMMNTRAQELGLQNSFFQNPSGLDETTFNQSTARDMALIMQAAMNNPLFREIAGASTHRAQTQGGRNYFWRNKHRLVTGGYENAIAGKTGFTKRARRTLVTSAQKDALELIVVTLRAGDDWNDHQRLFEYGFNNYQLSKILEVGFLNLTEAQRQEHGIDDRLFIRRDVFLPLLTDGSDQVDINFQLEEQNSGERAGTLQVLLNGDVLEEVPVYRFQPQDEGSTSWFSRLIDRFSNRNGRGAN